MPLKAPRMGREPRVAPKPVDSSVIETAVKKPSGDALLVVSQLEPAPVGKTYEAWVIDEGRARPAGLFAGGGRRTVFPLTRPVPDGALVAVTLEQSGGVPQPRSDPLFQSAQAA